MGDLGNDALVTIDGTDMKVHKGFDKKIFSHKFCSGGLRYEVGVCIVTGYIVWINGPFRCGLPDISIAQQALLGNLAKNKMVEVDAGYGQGLAHPNPGCPSLPIQEGEGYEISCPSPP